MTISMKELWGSSHISAGHAAYLESLYETYITDPNSLSEEWINFFENLPHHATSNGEISHQNIVREFKNVSRKNSVTKSSVCLLYTSPSPRDTILSRMPSSA